MIRLFKHYMPYAVLLLGFARFRAAARWRRRPGWLHPRCGRSDRWPIRSGPAHPAAAQLRRRAQCAMIAVGVYGDEALQSLRFAAARLLVAVSLGVILISLMFFLLPRADPVALEFCSTRWCLSIALLILVRAAARPAARRRGVQAPGARARRRRRAPRGSRRWPRQPASGFVVVGYVAMNDGPH